LLCALLLRPDHQKVENRKHQQQKTDLLGAAAATNGHWAFAAGGWRARRGRAATHVGLKQNVK
jgi:hypothetical protein